MEKVSSQYKKGFNHGYMISEHFPKVIKGMQIPKDEPTEYTQGFSDGQKHYEREQARGRIHETLANQKSQAKDRGMDMER